MTEQKAEQESRSDRDTWSGRTCPERSAATKAKTSRQSSKKSSTSQTKNPMYLSLRRENGRQPDASWATISPSLGECLMPNTGECPKEESVSTLSQILEETPHQKYYLSEKACLGILRRAEKRGKELPEILRLALIRQAQVECYDISDRRRVADKSEVSPTLTTKMGTGGNNVPIVLENHPQDSRVTIAEDGNVPTLTSRMGTGGGQCATHPQPITLQIRSGCEGGGKGALMQTDKSATLSTHNTQTLFDPIPIADKATRYKGGGDTRNNDGSANGLGIGEPGAPANTLTAADRHGVACFAQQAIGEYEESEKASCLKRRDYKDSTDLILWEYIIRRLTPLECCRLQGFLDNWAEELGIPEPTQEDINHWREVFRTQMEAMGESKKEKTDNQIRKWLKDPESDSAKYKMWGNGIALPCAMFVMEGIAMILSEEDADEQK